MCLCVCVCGGGRGGCYALHFCIYFCIIVLLLLQLLYVLFMCVFTFQAAGKYRQQGRNYVVEDGDIILFKFNTPRTPKKK